MLPPQLGSVCGFPPLIFLFSFFVLVFHHSITFIPVFVLALIKFWSKRPEDQYSPLETIWVNVCVRVCVWKREKQRNTGTLCRDSFHLICSQPLDTSLGGPGFHIPLQKNVSGVFACQMVGRRKKGFLFDCTVKKATFVFVLTMKLRDTEEWGSFLRWTTFPRFVSVLLHSLI